jgi:hypothetical protein
MILTEEIQRTHGKTCPIATLSTTNPIWTALGANLGLCGEKLAVNCLSYSLDNCFPNSPQESETIYTEGRFF